MTNEELWNDERELNDLGFAVPAWIEQDITPYDCMAIAQGGCNSGAYMPAVTYSTARETMAKHGDEIIAFIESDGFPVPAYDPEADTWSGFCCKVHSTAVELWVAKIMPALENLDADPGLNAERS